MSNVITVWGNSGDTGIITPVWSQPSGGIIYPGNVIPGTGNNTGNPGTGNGPGGIGVGDGGFSTPSDTTIAQPTITFPNPSDNAGITEADDATSSAFSATGGRTHVASRWLILYVGDGSDVLNTPPTIIYDSGPTTINLTTLPFAAMEFEHEREYRICVRYKASDTGTWSQWSPYQEFFTAGCVQAELELHYDMSSPSYYTIVDNKVATLVDLSGKGRNASNGTASLRPTFSTEQFATGAMRMVPGNFMAFSGVPILNATTGVTYTTFIVQHWTSEVGSNTMACGLASTNAVLVDLGLFANNSGTVCRMYVRGRFSNDTVGTGKYLLSVSTNGRPRGNVVFTLNGTTKPGNTTGDMDTNNVNSLCVSGPPSTGSGTWKGIAHFAEVRIYKDMTTDEFNYVTALLKAKWGI